MADWKLVLVAPVGIVLFVTFLPGRALMRLRLPYAAVVLHGMHQNVILRAAYTLRPGALMPDENTRYWVSRMFSTPACSVRLLLRL